MSTRATSAEPAVVVALIALLLAGCVSPPTSDDGDEGIHGDPIIEPNLTWIEAASPISLAALS